MIPDWLQNFTLPDWLQEFAPILILLAVVTLVIRRLPKVKDVDHSAAFRKRRVLNWLSLGLTYAFLYMGRYNLTVSKSAFEEMVAADGGVLMGNDDFGWIFGIGTYVYGFSFLLNGPLTDRFGGKFSILMGAAGAAIANLLMGLCAWSLQETGPGHEFIKENFLPVFATLYAANMYFQSFGAVAIVKVNAPWFHVRERGVFGAIFGILISLGIYFAFDLSEEILKSEWLGLVWVFFIPAILLAIFWVIDLIWVRNNPGDAGLSDFHTADASADDDGPRKSALDVFKVMLRNPVILTIAGIEFCSGFLRQALMQWYKIFAKQTDSVLHLMTDEAGEKTFIYENWGMLLCCAGILGGVFAGTISDHIFKSRRGPVAAALYGIMLVCASYLVIGYQASWVGWVVLFMSMAVIGVHGMLSGTASMDFGGTKNVGVAVGIIDGFVYMGTAVMSFTYAIVLPKEQLDEAGKLTGPVTDPANWQAWPVAMIPLALLGLLLATRIWNAKPRPKEPGVKA